LCGRQLREGLPQRWLLCERVQALLDGNVEQPLVVIVMCMVVDMAGTAVVPGRGEADEDVVGSCYFTIC